MHSCKIAMLSPSG